MEYILKNFDFSLTFIKNRLFLIFFGGNVPDHYLCTPKKRVCRVGQGVKTHPFHG